MISADDGCTSSAWASSTGRRGTRCRPAGDRRRRPPPAHRQLDVEPDLLTHLAARGVGGRLAPLQQASRRAPTLAVECRTSSTRPSARSITHMAPTVKDGATTTHGRAPERVWAGAGRRAGPPVEPSLHRDRYKGPQCPSVRHGRRPPRRAAPGWPPRPACAGRGTRARRGRGPPRRPRARPPRGTRAARRGSPTAPWAFQLQSMYASTTPAATAHRSSAAAPSARYWYQPRYSRG